MTGSRKRSFGQIGLGVVAGAALASGIASGCGASDTGKAPPLTTGSGGSDVGGGNPSSSGPGAGAGSQCGNDTKEAGEQCDGPDFGNIDCTSLGFNGGTLACTAACRYDESGCTGNENCQDSVDNDGDGKIDCKDPDCAAACAHACTKLPNLPDDATSLTYGLTTGHAIGAKPSCASGSSGSEVAYAFTAKHTGFLSVQVGTIPTGNDPAANLTLSVRKHCDDAGSEVACDNENTGTATTLLVQSVPVTMGDELTIAVSGFAASDVGKFSIYAESHPLKCGDAHVDPPEECDDGNSDSNDGCSSTCKLEPSEVEPNGTRASANALSAPWTAEISPGGDVDCVSIEATADGQQLVADTDDLGDGACGNGTLDSYLEIYDAAGTLLDSSDDGNDGLCAEAKTGTELVDGATYYVCVSAGQGSPNATFPYRLILTLM